MSLPKDLARLAEAHGIETAYVDTTGQTRPAGRKAVEDTLIALGVPPSGVAAPRRALQEHQRRQADRVLEPVTVAWIGTPSHVDVVLPDTLRSATLEFTLEGYGEVRRWRSKGGRGRAHTLPGYLVRRVGLPKLRPGYHTLDLAVGPLRARSMVISAPVKAQPPPRAKAWGLFTSVSALKGDGPMGSLAELDRLESWGREHGAQVVATLPMLADGSGPEHDPSPYNPLSRCFWDESYLNLDLVPESRLPEVQRVLQDPKRRKAIERLAGDRLMDRAKARDLQRPVLSVMLEALLAHGGPRLLDFHRYEARNPDLVRYARYCAGEKVPVGSKEALYHSYVQWLMDEQVSARSARDDGWGLYLDLPIGTRRTGFDTWFHPEQFAFGASMGAPPDRLFTGGQDWGFPPMHPERSRQAGYTAVRSALAQSMRHAGVLRIDHILGFHRLYWIPAGHKATEGVYVRNRAEELYAILTLESRRHKTIIVGEDLGTVPPAVRESMARHGLLRSYVWQLRASPEDPLPTPPPNSVATLNTHDTPSFAAWWQGHDIEQRLAQGWLTPEKAARECEKRQRTKEAVQKKLGPGDPLANLIGWLDRQKPPLALVALEDLWDETEPVNVPGTVVPENWRRRHRLSVAEAAADPLVAERVGRWRQRGAAARTNGARSAARVEVRPAARAADGPDGAKTGAAVRSDSRAGAGTDAGGPDGAGPGDVARARAARA